MNRRSFLAASSASLLTQNAFAAPRNKRDRMLAWLHGETDPGYTPAAFFLHFGPAYKSGAPAATRHLEFFRHTDMDFLKIQFEQTYTRKDFLQQPKDWAKLKHEKLDFYEPLLVTVRELVKAEKKNALILMTLYSPFMSAGHCATAPVLLRHLEENPEAVKKGLEILTDSQMGFIRACIREGIGGFYASTQGGEANRFTNPAIFPDYIKPYDLVGMKAAAACPMNILHVCDYVAPYANYDAVRDYPGHIVNCNVKLTGGEKSGKQIETEFNRPFMGGLDRHGVLANGTPAQIQEEIKGVLAKAPKRFLLGADCTVEANTSWDRLKQAIAIAHGRG